MSRPTWDEYFMEMAQNASTRSKDPSTKVGCCIVKDNRVLSLGYNGAPRRFPDELVPTSRDISLPLMEQKYTFVCHAEPNAMLNYGGSLRDFDGAVLYVTLHPCYECAKLICQTGIKEVVYRDEWNQQEASKAADYIFEKCGVNVRRVK